jgi:UDP-N-acetylglucosamine acyltransferase
MTDAVTSGYRHPTAIVSADAELHDSVELGPGVVIEGDVSIGAGSVIKAYSIVQRWTRLGERNQVGPHAVLGGAPQHKAYDGYETWLSIGNDNDIREFVTVSRAFERGAETRIGSNCLLMGLVHVAHDCHLGDNISMTNHSVLAGHIEVGDNCVFSGFAGGHQFIRIGKFCMLGPHVVLRKDVVPFTVVAEHPARHYRLNAIGLKRNGVTGDRYKALEQAFRALRRGDQELKDVPDTEETRYLKNWLAADSRFGILPFAKPGRR